MPSLDWIGKKAVIRHHKEVPFRLLEPMPELSCGEATGNLLVQGDNLDALKALLPRYAGRIKCIYIDPPYNTGNEGWSYNDNVNSPEIRQWLGEVVGKEGETLDRHDRWLCMMYPRLVLLRRFLRDDGVIFISIDDNEVAALRLLMDEIFGRRNFVAKMIWQKRTSPDARKIVSDAHEYIVVYIKNNAHIDASFKVLPLSEKDKAKYKNPDNDPRGPWASTDFTAQGYRPNQMYKITTPGGAEYFPPDGCCWKNIEVLFLAQVKEGRFWFGKNGKGVPRRKTYLYEREGRNIWTWWAKEEVGHTQEATQEITKLLGTKTAFDFPKPTRLIERILQISTCTDSIILDSFAGSGTTAHAVLKQNAEDGGNRRFIVVEMDAGIAEKVTAERLKSVIGGYANATGEAVPGMGGGFQFCRLSHEPLFTAAGEIRADVTFAQLADFVWFQETGTGYEGNADSSLLGVCDGKAVYLLYNGILKDKSASGGNVLTQTIYLTLPPHGGPKVIYAAASRGDAWLRRENITFKQTPYALDVQT